VIVLGIETSGRVGSVAVCDEGGVLADCTFADDSRRAREIVPAVDRVMQRAGLGRTDVDAVAVSEGPGSFTGLRVGVACAKMLAYALGWRAVGVPSLEVLAQNVGRAEGVCCPVLDARRGCVYGQVFRWEDDAWRPASKLLLLPPNELADRLPTGAIVFGSGVRAYPQVFCAPRFRPGGEGLEVGRAEVVARLGRERIRAGLAVDPMRLVPRYYRPTAPEEKLRSRGPQQTA